ncbi:MAG: rhomboid family intramembrane serine protease [Planctomycetota bacterium]
MFPFPLRTDRLLASVPWLNYALIAVNILVFLLTAHQVGQAHSIALQIQQYQAVDTVEWARISQLLFESEQLWVVDYYLSPSSPTLIQYFSYQYLHADAMHLVSNLVFLFAFGNSVEDRFGKVGYFAFYTACGVIAGLVHTVFDGTPIIGASGAIAGVTGAYLALFPASNITVAYWLLLLPIGVWVAGIVLQFFGFVASPYDLAATVAVLIVIGRLLPRQLLVGFFVVPSVAFIVFRIGQDIVFQALGVGGTAFLAHLAGYAMGFVVGMGLLAARVLPREAFDLISMLEQRRRRSEFQRLVREGDVPWAQDGQSAADATHTPDTPQAVIDQRARVDAALAANDLPEAAEAYRRLLELDARQVMAQRQQLDLANHFMAVEDHADAARAYEGFLRVHRGYADLPRVQLVLGLIYAKYLAQRDRARQLLEPAAQRLAGDDQALAKSTLAQLGT